jgi:hypothetical protein
MPRSFVAVIAFAAIGASAPLGAQSSATPIFRFETNELWLNLHHFLYVLGRAELKLPDSQRDAVVRAPADAQQELARLSDREQRIWRDAVRFYADNWSPKDLIFDSTLSAVTRALAGADDSASLTGVSIDTALAGVLQRAAAVYRNAWWPRHRAANERWVADVTPMIERHGPAVLQFITRAYGMSWPADGYPVHLSGYTNWAGAYSTRGGLLVVSGLDTATRGGSGLETVFHESMHQWDAAMFQLLREHARALGMLVPRSLSHVMLFYTAGEAVRRVIPTHVPYADANGVYERGWQSLRDAVVEIWKPYLDGHGTRDEALAALVKRTATEPRPATGDTSARGRRP